MGKAVSVRIVKQDLSILKGRIAKRAAGQNITFPVGLQNIFGRFYIPESAFNYFHPAFPADASSSAGG